MLLVYSLKFSILRTITNLKPFKMKTTLKLALLVLLVPVALFSQKTESQYIQWGGDDDIANAMLMRGMDHLMNIEMEKLFS